MDDPVVQRLFGATDSYTVIVGSEGTADVATSLMFHLAIQISQSTGSESSCTFVRPRALNAFPLLVGKAEHLDLNVLRRIEFVYVDDRQKLTGYFGNFYATVGAILPRCILVDQLDHYGATTLSSNEENLVSLLAVLHDFHCWAADRRRTATTNISTLDCELCSTIISLLLPAGVIEKYKLYLQLFTDDVIELSTNGSDEQHIVNVNKNGVKLFSCRSTETYLDLIMQ